MSSILNSLKKLENELTEQSKVQFRPQKKHTPKAGHQRLKDTWLFNKHVFVIFAVIILSVGTCFILNGKHRKNRPALVAKTQIKPEKTAGFAEEKPSGPNLPPQKMSVNKDAVKSKPITKKAKTVPIPAPHPRKKAPALAANTPIKPERLLTPHEKKTPIADSTRKKTTTPKNIKKYGPNTNIKRLAAIPVKQDNESRLRLQAIAWSSDPKDRMVVINDRIVREGESVEGVLVTHIGKDEVIFRKGSEKWRQMFRL